MNASQTDALRKKEAKILVGMLDYLSGADGVFNPGYTEEDVDRCSGILHEFVESLNRLGEKPAETQILERVKWVVSELNDLNEKVGGGLIETDQREDLCDYIDYAVQCFGMEPKGDITEEWRRW